MSDSSDPGAIISAEPVEVVASALEPLSPSQFAAVRRALSRSPFYIDDSTFIRIKVTANQDGYPINIGFRRANLAGGVQVNQITVVSSSDLTTHVFDTQLGEGLLYNVNVSGAGGPLPNRSVFVQVQLANGSGATATIVASLVSGYITGAQAFGWPGSPIRLSTEGPGQLRTDAIAPPGFGNEFSTTVPDRTRWELLSLSYRLTTGAFLANRLCYVQILAPSGVNMWVCESETQQAAAIPRNYQLGAGVTHQNAFQNDLLNMELPTPYYLEAGAKLQTFTVNLNVLDAYDQIEIHFREWLNVD
jgi:hypothetical protein